MGCLVGCVKIGKIDNNNRQERGMDWKDRLATVRLVVLDVDGTLTDGGMYYSAEGDVLKRFYVQDGMGITLLQRAGIEIALLTSENSPIVTARAKKLKITHVILGCQAKKKALEELSQKLSIPLEQVAYMGDDVNDEASMQIAGVKVCPGDALPRIQAISDYVCKRPGGNGAVREFAEMLLKAQNKSNTLPIVW
jgi:YrbI family 3-deoxy-D-manno-octulosonate 8-phosphate phosphatase